MTFTRTATAALAGAAALVAGVAAAPAASAHGDAPATPEVRSALAQTRAAVAPFHRVDAAVAAGYLPAPECVEGMGVHHADLAAVLDPAVDPSHPEVLVYEPQADGSMRLVAVEFVVLDLGQPRRRPAADHDRPTTTGRHRPARPPVGTGPALRRTGQHHGPGGTHRRGRGASGTGPRARPRPAEGAEPG